ncbi:Cyclin-A1-1 (G2/mitotic-specific cyclin-A1-1) (CycA1 [Durusdinium trenchii]|uniref:Cyclin-A1-1 (G2/mitotic-specific cyclin-A1-1) (CycA1) n=1 Tax=Durusdinium trenchii TaxID=1381693 RepID=A0ABP0MJQ7_9DINO
MFWWPVQGVTWATMPVIFACGAIKLLLDPQFNFTGFIPCTYSQCLGQAAPLRDAQLRLFASAQSDEKESDRCREGLLMMVSGSRLVIPRLREVEEQFLLQQPTHLLSREGLTLRAEQRQQIRNVPIRWKRAHLIFVSMFLVFPLTVLWEFTYCDFFGENALYFIIGFSFAMNFVDNALSRAVREELVQVPLSTACSVVLFVGTLGADDFVDFCEGFFLELLYGIAERLILGTLFEEISPEEAVGLGDLEVMVQEGTPIEEAMEEVIGCGTTCMSTIMTPFIIAAIYVFAQETEIPVEYDIRSRDLVCYLLFGIIIAPFQVMMDILMNHVAMAESRDPLLGETFSHRSGTTAGEPTAQGEPERTHDITNIPDARDRKKPMLREPLAVLQPARPAPVVPEVLPTPMDICNTEAILDAHDKVQAVAEYAPEILEQLFLEEATFMPRPNYMDAQHDINGKMRAILVDWLVEVHMKYRLRPETLFLAVNLIDRHMSLMPVLRRRLQLLGVVAMFVASKFEEIDPPRASDFVYITDNTYTKDELLQMECHMLSSLEFQVVVPTAAHFINHMVKANLCENPRHVEVIKFIIELSLVDLRMIRHKPSLLVAAAVLLSNELFGRGNVWPDAMVQISHYSEMELRGCCEELRQLVRQAPSQQLQAVRKKYMLQQHHQVARNAVLASWLFDDPRLDQSIAEPLQSVNHLAFSPQFYFIETYYTWGMLVSLLSITVFLRKELNPLDDPALFLLVGQMFLLNYLLDRMIRWLTSSVLWKPMDNSNFRIFSRSVALALQRKDAAVAQEKYRQWFWQRHSGWLVSHLNDIFTPRSRERYKGKLSLLYQQALQLQPTRVYKTPGEAFPEPVGQQELPENLRLEYLGSLGSRKIG